MPNNISQYEIALGIARKAHKGQVDKAGRDYLEHPLHLAAQFEDDDHKAVAMLHDVLEDTDLTADYLREQGISDHNIRSVVCLTKKDGESADVYYGRVMSDRVATDIKIADTEHNKDLTRLSLAGIELTDHHREKAEEYTRHNELLREHRRRMGWDSTTSHL